ncbi:hypothetical protein SAMN02910276_00825 [Butyrivibrio sp. Su6]|uniref:hypothetical protein n=1 Tax=Butyrivibrio sp. Su6 TaxID=1520810 RepID=UPI00089E7404|nr:hypothetical protein [Butyrivibrio sp. Su6]SEF67932.1 hypothetical protein SAMN02910276_00825 [Butyrivibrio sp. Su6]
MKKTVAGMFGIAVGFCFGVIFGSKWVGKQYDLHCEKIEKNGDKFSDYYQVCLQWVKVHQAGKKLDDYFNKKGYRHIAVYGMNDIAHAIISELKDSGVEVDYGIDRNADNLFLEMECYRPDADLPTTDVCVIALPELYKEIYESLNEKLTCPIVSIEDVVWGM